jgi:flagellar hook-associated protein 3 FlgL
MAISFLSLMNAPRSSVADTQQRLIEAQGEVATGRYWDQGLKLGGRTEEAVVLRAQFDRNAALIDTNGVAKAELDLAQSTLSSIADLAHRFTATLIGARDAVDGQQIAKDAAKAGLASLISLVNVAHDGQHVFGGINSNDVPLADYFASPPAASKSALDAAFQTEFGFNQSSPAVNGITPAQMDAFLNGGFDAQFAPGSWQGNWSQAATANRTLRLDRGLIMESSVNANEPAFRELAAAFTMVLDLGTANLSQSTFEQLTDRAALKAAQAGQDVGELQGRLGHVQQSVTEAITILKSRNQVLNGRVTALEAADPYEAATNVNRLTTQLEASYALTARIGRLSLLNYL